MTKTAQKHGKKWYMSRTLRVNVLVFSLAVIDAYNASFGMPTEVYAFVIPVINVMLRMITEDKLTF